MALFAIKLAGPEDAGSILYLLEKHINKLPQEYLDLPKTTSDKTLGKLRRQLSSKNPPFSALIARDKVYGTPLGLVLWYYSFSSWNFGEGLVIEEFFVIGGPYRDNVGQELIRVLLSLAKKKGNPRIEARPYGLNSPESTFLSREIGMRHLIEWRVFRDYLRESTEERFGDFEKKHKKITLPMVRMVNKLQPNFLQYQEDIHDTFELIKSLAGVQEINARFIRVSPRDAYQRLQRQIESRRLRLTALLAQDVKDGRRFSVGLATLFKAYHALSVSTYTFIEDFFSALPKEAKGLALYREIYKRAKRRREPFIETRVLTYSRTFYGAMAFLKKMGMEEITGARRNMLRLDIDSFTLSRLGASDQILQNYSIDPSSIYF